MWPPRGQNQLASVKGDDLAGERQPEPQSSGLGREKRAQAFERTRGEAGPIVFDGHQDGAGLRRRAYGHVTAGTRGFEPGNFNIFIMDVATREVVQLTHGAGRNENPTWAPDGRHLVFSSRRGSSTQIYSMLADGTDVKPLTTQGQNTMPVWSK